MLQKFKITSCASILVLFGFSLMTVSPVLAHNAEAEDLGDHTHEHEEAAVDDAEGTKEALKLQIEEINGWLEEKDARIADLQEQLSTASSELQDKDETIADLQSQLTDVKINSIKGMSLEGLRDLISELVAAEEEMVAAELAAEEERAAAEIKAKTREYCTDRTREEGTCIGGRTPDGFCSPRPFHPGCKDMKAMDPEWRLDRAFRGCEKDQSGEGGFTGCKDPD